MVFGTAGSVHLDTAWYLVKLGQHKAFMPVHIEKSGDLVGCYHSRTDEQTRKDRATQPMDHGRLR